MNPPTSITPKVLVALLCATTVVLVLFGGFDYYGTRKAMDRELDEDLSASAEQLASGLAVALWQVDVDSMGRIMDSAMLDQRIAAVVVHDSQTNDTLARSRGQRGRIESSPLTGDLAGLRNASRDIVYQGQTIGAVEVLMSTRTMETTLRNSLLVIGIRILVLNIVLTLLLAFVLRRIALSPLKALEQYAVRVSAGSEELTPLQAVRFYGELETLRSAIAHMVTQLKAAENRYRDIYENALEGIFQSTLEGAFIRVNPALAHMLGYESPVQVLDVFTNLRGQLYVRPKDRDVLLAELHAHGSVTGYETLLQCKDGRAIWSSITARLVKDENNDPSYIEGFISDVNTRRLAEEELAGLNQRLEQLVEERTRDLLNKSNELERLNLELHNLDQLKSSLITTVSHDLRTPLTSVLGFVKLIYRDFSTTFSPLANEDQKLAHKGNRILENLNIISQEGERLTRLITEFLDLSKIEAGLVEYRDVPVAVSELVAISLKAASGMFALKPDVSVHADVSPDMPRFLLDPDRMVQVLVNLINNAVKFTDQGEVHVTACRSKDNNLSLVVSDTGIGIPTDKHEAIFDKFRSVSEGDTMTGRDKGSGLGLAICRHIVERYGGKIWVESEPGKGSQFHILLPKELALKEVTDLEVV
ncbi:MAG: PAS domain S-box protein [Desulfovibrio sp.]|nr:MAG: PAS domain S-box protein [Desulfovibrio sp.]